jgi:exonuclease III
LHSRPSPSGLHHSGSSDRRAHSRSRDSHRSSSRDQARSSSQARSLHSKERSPSRKGEEVGETVPIATQAPRSVSRLEVVIPLNPTGETCVSKRATVFETLKENRSKDEGRWPRSAIHRRRQKGADRQNPIQRARRQKPLGTLLPTKALLLQLRFKKEPSCVPQGDAQSLAHIQSGQGKSWIALTRHRSPLTGRRKAAALWCLGKERRMTTLSVLSFHVQGLATHRRRVSLRSFLHEDLRRLPDVFCFQEHKLREGFTGHLQSELWKEAHFVNCPAIDGIHAVRNRRVLGGKGGVGIAIHPKWIPYITQEGKLPSMRGAWVRLEHPKWGALAFLAIYAPNQARARTTLWTEIVQELDHTINWIFCGDYNMVEREVDCKGGRMETMAGAERIAWNNVKRRFHLEDSFSPRPGHLSFSWDSGGKHRHVLEIQAGPARDRLLNEKN